MRIKPYEVLPPFRWFLTWIQEFPNGTEYRMAALKLPSWQWKVDICWDEYRWHQLVILYHGRDGFQVHWWATPDRESAAGGGQ